MKDEESGEGRVLQTIDSTTPRSCAIATTEHARHDTGRGTLCQVRNPRSLALMEVPAVLVEAFALPSCARMGRGFHLVVQDRPRNSSTLTTFAGFHQSIIRRGCDAIGRRRITHIANLV